MLDSSSSDDDDESNNLFKAPMKHNPLLAKLDESATKTVTSPQPPPSKPASNPEPKSTTKKTDEVLTSPLTENISAAVSKPPPNVEKKPATVNILDDGDTSDDDLFSSARTRPPSKSLKVVPDFNTATTSDTKPDLDTSTEVPKGSEIKII